MMSDLLKSGKSTNPPSEVPTRDAPLPSEMQNEYQPTGLVQKLCKISPFLILAWAGSPLQARALAVFFQDRLPVDCRDLAVIEEVLYEYDPSDMGDLAAVLAVHSSQGLVSFDLNTAPYSIGPIDKLWCMGDGSAALYDFLERFKSNGAPAHALTFMGMAMASQYHSGYGLENSWGGGFQVAVPGPNAFEYLDHILVRAWLYGTDDRSSFGRGPFFYSFYRGDDLVFCRIGGKNSGAYVIAPPVHKSEQVTDFNPGLYKPRHTVDLVLQNGKIASITTIASKAKDYVELRPGKFTADVSEETQRRVEEAAFKVLNPST